jgi:hypothetical protein
MPDSSPVGGHGNEEEDFRCRCPLLQSVGPQTVLQLIALFVSSTLCTLLRNVILYTIEHHVQCNM